MGASNIYDHVTLYDKAFSYRDIDAEVTFLCKVYSLFSERTGIPKSLLEIASGTGRHALAFARLGVEEIGLLDSSVKMLEHAAAAFAESKASVSLFLLDMRDFVLPRQYELAICMLDGLSHLTEETELLAHFDSVSAALKPGGIYIAEFASPTRPDHARRSKSKWTVEDDQSRLSISWGATFETLDTERRINKIDVELTDEPKDGRPVLTERNSYIQREWTFEKVTRCIRRSRGMQIVGSYGNFDPTVEFRPEVADGPDWRMILVVKRSQY
jgi:SAM-dependent methyltransferase